MEALLQALEATSLAQDLRVSRWSYAAVNAAHILGIALLVGAVVPLNLRLLGAWPGVPREAVARILVPVAASGLALAAVAGLALFAVRAREYGDLGVFQLKLLLVGLGTVSALALHLAGGRWLERAGQARMKAHAVFSMACWGGALACGRLIAFVNG